MEAVRRYMTEDLVLDIIETTPEGELNRCIDVSILWKGSFICQGASFSIGKVEGSLEDIIDNYRGFSGAWSSMLQSLSDTVTKQMDKLQDSINALATFNDWVEDTLDGR